jgi:hypothetical protein
LNGYANGGKEAALTPTLIFLVSALVATLVIGTLAEVFATKRFRPEATLAAVLALVTIAGWIWRMPRGWRTMSQIAWRYRLKTSQVREVANKLGMPFNRGALVPPSQQKKMRPELMRLKKWTAVPPPSAVEDSRLVVDEFDKRSGFLEEAERMQFSGKELMRHLRPSITDHVADVDAEAG